MKELYTVNKTTFTDINMALIEEAKTGTKMIVTTLNEMEAIIDRTIGDEMIVNDDDGEILHVFEIKTGLDDLNQGDECIGKVIEVESVEIYGNNITKINFTEEFKRDLSNSAENAVNEIMENA